jgi:hypothetical protein
MKIKKNIWLKILEKKFPLLEMGDNEVPPSVEGIKDGGESPRLEAPKKMKQLPPLKKIPLKQISVREDSASKITEPSSARSTEMGTIEATPRVEKQETNETKEDDVQSGRRFSCFILFIFLQ